MIQRIQTVYLLLASIVIGLLFLSPFAGFFPGEGKVLGFFPYGLVEEVENATNIVFNTLPLAILTGLILTGSFISIFLFNNRNLQARICMMSMLLLIGFYGLAYFYIMQAQTDFGDEISYYYPTVFPLVGIIFLFLARKRINKDEQLIRSVDRIR